MPVEILVVDDEPDLALLIRQKFRKRIRSGDWEFYFAHNGYEALEMLDAKPDIMVVLTDLNMPEMDGLTLLDHLSKSERLLKAVVVSAYGDMSNIRTAMNRGAFDFVTKPVDFDDLEITVDKTLREVTAYREAIESKIKLSTLQKELAVARRIQKAFIPKDSIAHENVEIKAHLDTAREVGGDFYDFFMLDQDRLAIAIGDVAGKGVSAALFMAITRTLLRAIALKGSNPGRCLTEVNSLLYPQSLPEVFVTALYGILNLKTGHFSYATAGHFPPYWLKKDAALQTLKRTHGIGLCLTHKFEYKDNTIQLDRNDGLFIYTDGLTEATKSNGEQFSNERLEHALNELPDTSTHVIVKGVMDALDSFTQGAVQLDDITLLALSYCGE